MKIFKKMKKGFTLVELVVVIAVIAILAAVSVGAYFGVTESANRSKLEQEGKQVQTAIQTISLAGNEHSSLDSTGLTISDLVGFKDALVESLGKDVALSDEQDKKDDNLETICFFAQNETNTLIGDKKYNFFEYHIPNINGKKAAVNLITGEVNVLESTAAGEDIPDPITTIEEALSAKKGLTAILDGTVVRISDEWNDTDKYMSFIIEDETGKSIEVYKCNTLVEVGDIVTVTGKIGQYNSKNQIAAGSTAKINGHDTSKDEIVYITSIVEALAAPDNTHVKVIGTVVSIETAYNSQYENISLTIADEQGNRLPAYRVKGNAEINNIVEITGQLTTYKGNKQVAEGGTLELKEGTHTCSNFTEADCNNAAKCIVCGKENGTKLEHIDGDSDGFCDACEANMNTITVSVVISDYATKNGWELAKNESTDIKYRDFNIDDNINITANGGANTGKYYSNGWRLYATDTPAATVKVTAKEGYELSSIQINALTGEYADLLIENGTSNVANQEVEVTGSSVLFNVSKNGSNGKQLVVTSITVKYIEVENTGGETPDEPEQPTLYTLTITTDPADATVVLNAGEQTVNGKSIEVEENTTVTYTVSKDGYETVNGNITVSETTNLPIKLEAKVEEPEQKTEKTLTLEFSNTFGIPTGSYGSGEFEAKGVTFGYAYLKSYASNGKYVMFEKSKQAMIYNKTAIPGVITKLEATTTSGCSAAAAYKINLFTSVQNTYITSGTNLTGQNATAAVTGTESDNYSYFNISSVSSTGKNGQIAKIVITYLA